MTTRLQNIGRLVGLACCLLLAGVDPAPAGAPAPAPTAAGGPHLPEHQLASIGDFRFENGEVVKDFKVSYVTHGKLSPKKDNVILVMHHWAGDHHTLDFLMGPGKALDTDKYFVVATDGLGNSNLRQDVTTGPANSGLKMEFPRYTLRDSVNVEYKLLKEYLGFDHILAAIGPSVGAMKTFQFAASYPTYVSGIIPIVGSAVTNPQTRMMIKHWMEIIALDSGWQSGNYEANPTTGLGIAFINFSPWTYTNQWFATSLKTAEDYRGWKKIWHDWAVSQDARDVYYQWQAWADFNIGDTPGFKGDAKAALQSLKAQVLLIGGKQDLLFNRDELIFARNAIPKATHVEIDSPWGHVIAFDPEAVKIIGREIAKFLSKLR